MGMKQGVALENSTSTSQQNLQSYPQQSAPLAPAATQSHSPTAGHYIYQQPHSPVPPQSPVSIQLLISVAPNDAITFSLSFWYTLSFSVLRYSENLAAAAAAATAAATTTAAAAAATAAAAAAATAQLAGVVQVHAIGEQAVAAVVT